MWRPLARPLWPHRPSRNPRPTIEWRLRSSYAKSIDVIFGAAKTLSRYVSEATDNAFQIKVHAAGELTPSRQALDAVSSGAVECAHTPLFFYAHKDPTLGLGSGLPFGLNARQQLSWWNFGGGGGSSMPRSRSSTCTASRPASPGRRWAPGSRRKSTRSTISRACASASARSAGRSSPGSACCRTTSRMPTSTRRSRTAPSMPPNSSARTTTRSSGSSEGGEVQPLPVLVGKRRHGASGRQSRQVECAAEILSGHRRPGPAMRPTPGCSPSTTRSIRRR